MSSIRHHTLLFTFDKDECIAGVMLEKDWFSGTWCELFNFHQREARPQGIFHVVNQSQQIDPTTLSLWVDAAIKGQFVVIDLREYSAAAARRHAGTVKGGKGSR